MIPHDEVRLLVITFSDATERARGGAVAWGLSALGAGIARAWEAQAAGEPWAAELAARWEALYRQFRQCFASPLPLE